MRDWYGPPIALSGVPGRVFAAKGGDFIGTSMPGNSAAPRIVSKTRCDVRSATVGADTRSGRRQLVTANAFPASLSDLIAASGNGKTRRIAWQKVGPTGVIGVTSSLWRVGNQPAAGGAGSAARAAARSTAPRPAPSTGSTT